MFEQGLSHLCDRGAIEVNAEGLKSEGYLVYLSAVVHNILPRFWCVHCVPAYDVAAVKVMDQRNFTGGCDMANVTETLLWWDFKSLSQNSRTDGRKGGFPNKKKILDQILAGFKSPK
jgi:hypothetical protein